MLCLCYVIYFVHRRTDHIDTGFVTTFVCRQYSGAWFFSTRWDRHIHIEHVLNASASYPTGCVLTDYSTANFWQNLGPLVYDRQTPDQLPVNVLLINGLHVTPVTSIRNLDIFIDANLVMWNNVQQTVSGCFAVFCQLWQIRNSLSTATFPTFMVAPVMFRVQTGLWKQYADWSSDSSDTAPDVRDINFSLKNCTSFGWCWNSFMQCNCIALGCTTKLPSVAKGEFG